MSNLFSFFTPFSGFKCHQSSCHSLRHSHHSINFSVKRSSVDKIAQFPLIPTPLLYFSFFSPFLFLIFQHLRCSGSLKHPWGLRVRAFVSHFLLKQFFFNPMRLFTVVVLALSSPSLFLLSFSPSHPHHPPSVFSVSARGQCYTFFFCMREGRGYLFSYYNLKIEKKNWFKVGTMVSFKI